MMKKKLNIILILVLIGMLTAIFIIKNNPKGSDTTSYNPFANNNGISLFSADTAKIIEVKVEKDGKVYDFKTDGNNFVQYLPKDIKLISTEGSALAGEFRNFLASSMVEKDPKGLKIYGLDKPRAVITVKTSDGLQKVIEIGNIVPTGQGYYTRISGDSAVYIIPNAEGQILDINEDQIRDRVLIPPYSDKITQFSLKKSGNMVLAMKKAGDKWRLTYPVIHLNLNAEKISSLLAQIVATYAKDFIKRDVRNFNKYNLDEPAAYKLAVTEGGETVKILLGTEKNGATYARLEGSNEVITIDSASLAYLGTSAKDIIDGFVSTSALNDINKFVINIGGETTTCDITHGSNGKAEKFAVNGGAMHSIAEDKDSLFKNYFGKTADALAGDLDIGAEPKGIPKITFTFSSEDAKKNVVIEFIPKNSKWYYALRNGIYTGAIVNKDYFGDAKSGVIAMGRKLVKAYGGK